MFKATSPEVRFFEKVSEHGDCWIWDGAKIPSGYGRFWSGSKQVASHRWVYEFMVGPIPEGLFLDHLCRQPSCVNPWHLDPVTPLVNTQRGLCGEAMKTHCPHGHPYSGTNLIRHKRGRVCRTCDLARQRRQTEEKRARRLAEAS